MLNVSQSWNHKPNKLKESYTICHGLLTEHFPLYCFANFVLYNIIFIIWQTKQKSFGLNLFADYFLHNIRVHTVSLRWMF